MPIPELSPELIAAIDAALEKATADILHDTSITALPDSCLCGYAVCWDNKGNGFSWDSDSTLELEPLTPIRWCHQPTPPIGAVMLVKKTAYGIWIVGRLHLQESHANLCDQLQHIPLGFSAGTEHLEMQWAYIVRGRIVEVSITACPNAFFTQETLDTHGVKETAKNPADAQVYLREIKPRWCRYPLCLENNRALIEQDAARWDEIKPLDGNKST